MSNIEIMPVAQVERMRAACQLAADTLVDGGRAARAGMTTDEINTLVHEHTLKHGARPSPLNYHGFPKSVCTSVNEVVCHGIPGATRAQGRRHHQRRRHLVLPAQAAFTATPAPPSTSASPAPRPRRWSRSRASRSSSASPRSATARASATSAPPSRSSPKAQGCSVVRDFVGHGIGREFHAAPQVKHYGTRGSGKRLKAGMIFTIEPMINIGATSASVLDDDWTVAHRGRLALRAVRAHHRRSRRAAARC